MRSIVLLFSIIFLLLFSCSDSTVAGGSTDTELGGGALSGHVVSRNNTPLEKATVTLFEKDFNPIQNSPVPTEYQRVTNGDGFYRFDSLEQGDMRLVIQSADGTEILFKESLNITGDSLYIGLDTLQIPGAAKMYLPHSFNGDTLNLLTGYLFVYGTNFYQRLSEESIYSDGDGDYIIFDDLPPQKIPSFYYAEEYNAKPPQLLVEELNIVSGDTVTANF